MIPWYWVLFIAGMSCLAGFFFTAIFLGRKISRLEDAIINALIADQFNNDHEEIMDGLRAALNNDFEE